MIEAFPFFEISGTPYARGIQYGQQAASRIHAGINHYAAQIEKLELKRAGLEAIVRDYLPVMERFDGDYVHEMRGIAKGADTAFEDIVLLNDRTEILKLASDKELRQKLIDTGALDGCTSIAVLPEVSADGEIIHAQNWDWKMECADTSIVLCVRREGGPDVLTFTEAGALGRSGLNSAGLSLTANYLEASIDYRQVGVPLPLVRRKILESEHYALALHAAYVTKTSGSTNITIAHKDGLAINLECAPDETFVTYAEHGLIVHANHWTSPIALSKFKDLGVASSPDTLYRDLRVRKLLQEQDEPIDVDTVKFALADDFASPWSVCRPARLNMMSNLSATVATLVMRTAKKTLEIAPLPAQGNAFTTYQLD